MHLMEDPTENEEELIGRPIDEVPEIEPDGNCNARRRDRDAGGFAGYCRNPEGKGTEHVGEGRCKFHGGGSPRGPEHPTFKHGIFSDYLSDEDQEAVEALREIDNSEKLQSIIDWRMVRLRRAVREFFNDDAEERSFWEAFQTVVDSTGDIDSGEIRELAKMLDTGNRAMQNEIDLIRKLIKDYDAITDEGSALSLELEAGHPDQRGSISINWNQTDREVEQDG